MSAEQELARAGIGPLTRTDLVRYAGAGGDFNPVHHDEVFAQAAGYPSVIGHGLLTAGLAGSVLAEAVGPLNLRRYAVKYTGQVFPGDVLDVVVRAVGEEGGIRQLAVTVEARSRDAAERVVLTATAEAAVEAAAEQAPTAEALRA